MKNKTIDKFALNLANEISERKVYKIEEISELIKVRTKFVIRDLILENTEDAEIEYMKLVNEISKLRRGSAEWEELSYKISVAKKRKTSSNRTANNLGRVDELKILKQFVKERFGDAAMDEFYEFKDSFKKKDIKKQMPIYSTKIN